MNFFISTIKEEYIPEQISSICNQGWNLYHRQKYYDAIKCFDNVISKYPNYLKALWRRHETFRVLGRMLEDNNYIKMAIKDIDTCLKYRPNDSSLYVEKAYLYNVMNDVNNSIKSYNKAIKIDPFDSDIYKSIAIVYREQENFSKALYYYDLALQYLPYKKEFSVIQKCIGKVDQYEMKCKMLDLLRKTSLSIGKQILSEFENLSIVTNNSYEISKHTIHLLTDETELHLEKGDLFLENNYYCRALIEYNYAISINSHWPESFQKRSRLFQILGAKYNKNWILSRAQKDLIQFGKISLNEFNAGENKYKILYNALKSADQSTICGLLDLFKDDPQTIVNIITDYSYSNLTLNDYYPAFNTIRDFSLLLQYLNNSSLPDHQKMGMKAIFYYYLGGLTYSFIIFDEILDVEISNTDLSSLEMYYYSKSALEIEIEFIAISNYNIKCIEQKNKENIDYYYLGQLYYLIGDKKNAIRNFKQSTSFIYSSLMLFYLTKNDYYIKNIKLGMLLPQKNEINCNNNNLSQFYNYFHFSECIDAIEYWIYDRNLNGIEILHKNIWDIFYLSEATKEIISQDTKTKEIIKNIQKIYINGDKHSIYDKDEKTQIVLINEFQNSLRNINKSTNKEITIASRIFNNGGKNIDIYINIISYYYNIEELNLKTASTLFLYLLHNVKMANTIKRKEITQNIISLCLKIMFTDLAIIMDMLVNVIKIMHLTKDSKHSNPYSKFDYLDFKVTIWKKIAENENYESIIKQML